MPPDPSESRPDDAATVPPVAHPLAPPVAPAGAADDSPRDADDVGSSRLDAAVADAVDAHLAAEEGRLAGESDADLPAGAGDLGANADVAPVVALSPSRVEGDELVLTFPDPDHALTGVRLWVHLATPLEREFAAVPGGWELRQPLPDLDRLEYMVEITDSDGQTQFGLDPTNPLRVGGAFGDHSWLPLPGYSEPAWTAAPRLPHHVEVWTLEVGPDEGELRAHVVSPADTGPGEELPLLVVHDGPEMDALGGIGHCVDALVGFGRAPRLRLALLEPGPDRNGRYAANPAYADLLGTAVDVLTTRWPSPVAPVVLGASLGALAALHTQWTHPGTFAGLFLASGSFFSPDLDPGERGFAHWDAITGFTGRIEAATTPPGPLGAVAIVCGTAEENHGNNLALREHLHRLGVDAPEVRTVRDGHNYTCWRDLFDPALPDLLARAWS